MANDSFAFFPRREKYKRIFLTNTFYIFAVAILLCEILFSIFIYYFSSYSQYADLKARAVMESNHIDNSLKDIFSETHQVMLYVGKQVSLYSKNDPLFIKKILMNSSDITSKMKTMYSWSLFDWIDRNNYVIVNSQIGVVKKSPDRVGFSFVSKCPDFPWTLQLSHPTIGNTSGMWVIPAGVGITDEKNRYLGTLNVGFNVAELNNKIQQLLSSKESSFVVLDEELKIILQSADNTIDPKSSYYRDLINNKKVFKESEGILEKPLEYKTIRYTFYKKMEDYPYLILTGFDTVRTEVSLWNLILPRFLELYGLGAFCLGLLYFLRRKMFTLIKISEAAQGSLSQRISRATEESLSSILMHSSILLKYFTNQTKVVVTKEKQLNFIEKIHEEALSLYTMTSHYLQMSLIEIKELIEGAIDVQMENFLKKGITLKVFLPPSPFHFYGDAFRLKQIITSLLFLASEYSPKGSTVKVSATVETRENEKMFLIITIEDNGFDLNAEDIRRISQTFSSTSGSHNVTEIFLDFSDIEKLIKLHNGDLYILSGERGGKIIKIILPYLTKEEVQERENTSPEKRDNVYHLFNAKKHMH